MSRKLLTALQAERKRLAGLLALGLPVEYQLRAANHLIERELARLEEARRWDEQCRRTTAPVAVGLQRIVDAYSKLLASRQR